MLIENSQKASRAAQNTLADHMRAACLKPLDVCIFSMIFRIVKAMERDLKLAVFFCLCNLMGKV